MKAVKIEKGSFKLSGKLIPKFLAYQVNNSQMA